MARTVYQSKLIIQLRYSERRPARYVKEVERVMVSCRTSNEATLYSNDVYEWKPAYNRACRKFLTTECDVLVIDTMTGRSYI